MMPEGCPVASTMTPAHITIGTGKKIEIRMVTCLIIIHVFAVRKLRKVVYGNKSVVQVSRQIPKWESHLFTFSESAANKFDRQMDSRL